jgi:glycosyltransferase involved in cell wall biosynthesis
MNPKLGGPAQGIRNYEYGLRDTNTHRDIVCFDNPLEVNSWIAGSLKVIGLGVVNNRLNYHSKLKSWLLNNMLNYDVVIINGLWQYHSVATINVMNILKARGNVTPKVFIMPHGMLDPWFQKATSRKLKAIRNSLYWHLIEKKVINSADGILFTCLEELELAKTTFEGYKPKQTFNIGYGIAPPPIFRQEMEVAFAKQYTLGNQKPYWLYLSRIDPKKGVDLLIDAYESILNHNSDIPNLVIAGPGADTDYGRAIVQRVLSNSLLSEHIQFVGMVLGDAKWGAIYGCDAFVLPSHQENFGIVVAEALACSKPVLITNKVNIYKEIVLGEGGIVEDDTLKGIISLLNQWLQLTKDNKALMNKNAFKTYEHFFNVKETAQNLIDAVSSY